MCTVILLKIHETNMKYCADTNKSMAVFLFNSSMIIRASESLVLSPNSPVLFRSSGPLDHTQGQYNLPPYKISNYFTLNYNEKN